MIAVPHQPAQRFEDLLAELTIAAYDVTLKYHTGRASLFETEDSFIDAELALWVALRGVLDEWLFTAPNGPGDAGEEDNGRTGQRLPRAGLTTQ